MMKCMVAAVTSLVVNAQSGKQGPLSLEHTLRAYRTQQAFQRSVPAYTIFGNKLMQNIAVAKPNTLKQLLTLRGMGSKRCKAYGSDILKLVGDGIEPPAPCLLPATAPCSKPKAKPKTKPKTKPTAKSKGAAPAQAKPGRKPAGKRQALSAARPRPKPRPKPKPPGRPRPVFAAPSHPGKPHQTNVYILELEDGRVYVGSSGNVERRIAQHAAGAGSAYTRVYKPTGVRLPRLGNISGDGDAAERDETLRYMYQRGIPFVRGWKFVQPVMPPEQFDEAEANIRELYDLCRRCGYKGHFRMQCKATYDRWGKPC
jgi:predicted GIY-YIG superfamily endonuclease